MFILKAIRFIESGFKLGIYFAIEGKGLLLYVVHLVIEINERCKAQSVLG